MTGAASDASSVTRAVSDVPWIFEVSEILDVILETAPGTGAVSDACCL